MYAANVRASIARALFRVESRKEMHNNVESLETCTEVVNRNPRNLERLRIARKPEGYHLEVPGRKYWHKLYVIKKPRYITAEVHHFKNGPVVTASSMEWALKKHLYRGIDGSAYINVGRVLAQRCLEAGICEMKVDNKLTGEKCKLLITQLTENGICLTEPPVYKYPNSWDRYRPEKPWEIHE
ncbi:large ribosomal subunit protein uL18m [Anoplolepis gracilipes]|uniref:large ribosomal subunit protein uL18m n=1 Tax=Anoplolepis gracilipes TaxID=354296 RepID=UPI003BA11B5C